ncbi:MAG: hypothetical protein ACETV0_08650 [Nitrososphaeria archaeon]
MASVGAQAKIYHVERQWSKVFINYDRSISILYNITFVNDPTSSGSLSWITLGMPKRPFQVVYVVDASGQHLNWQDASSGDWSGIRIGDLNIPVGGALVFFVNATVPDMVFDDATNPGNVGMQFTPAWWDCSVRELRLAVVLPDGVGREEIRVTPNWDNLLQENGRYLVYWERHDLSPNEKVTFGASFPAEYVSQGTVTTVTTQTSTPTPGPALGALGVIFFIFVLVAGAIGVVVSRARKQTYVRPSIGIEGLGPRRGLTAVEAAYLLTSSPTRILTMILFSAMRKGAAEVVTVKPRLRLRVSDGVENLRYYERSFLDAVTPGKEGGGYLDEDQLLKMFKILRDGVEQKLAGYCRQDTVLHYQEIVNRAWEQVTQAQTPQVKLGAASDSLEWLMTDPNFDKRIDRVLTGDEVVVPLPGWWWWWLYTRQYSPVPTPSQATTPAKAPSLTEYANAIVTGIENTSNSIVANTEKFADTVAQALAPAPPPSKPVVQHSSCVCACVSCACVCACVSCACACAGGGAG